MNRKEGVPYQMERITPRGKHMGTRRTPDECTRRGLRLYKAHPNAVRNTSLPSSSSPCDIPFTIPPPPPLPYPEDLLPLYTPHPRLFGWDGKQFDEYYHRKLDKLWYHWKSACKEAYSKED